MKRLFSVLFLGAALITTVATHAQADKSKRPSPPMTVTQTLKGGATVTINYSQPSLKGRTIGKDIEPMDGKVWRAGANEATVFEVSQDVKVEGKALPAGKYALFMISGEDEWTIIFNKKWQTWGAYDYAKNKGEDALQVKVKVKKADPEAEKLTYTIDDKGNVTLLWGERMVSFRVK